MRLSTFIVTLSVCALHARTASISTEKKLDDLDNVDLDNVNIEPELIDQVTIKDVDNNLRKTIVDIPVKVVEEPVVVNENSNDYIPENDENIVVKRVEIDLANPGPPQRQEHETQNPENYGERERAIFDIKKTVDNTQRIFNQGLQDVSNSFKTLFGANEDLPTIQGNLQNLRQTFSEQIEKLNETIRTNLKSDSIQTNEGPEKTLEVVDSRLDNLQKNFKQGVDILTEGVEILTIIREEDEADKIKTKSIVSEKSEDVKADTTPDAKPDTKPQPDSTSSTTQNPTSQTPAQTASNPISQMLLNFQNAMTNAFSGLTSAIQNNFGGNQQPGSQQSSNPQPAAGNGNPITNLFQGISFPNINQGQNTVNPSTQGQEGSKPAEAQSDTAAAAVPTQAPWGPQAIFQQIQNSWQNLVSPGQNVQQTTQQTQQNDPPVNNGPIAQAIQGIVQFIQRPGQAAATQPPANPSPTPQKIPEKPSEPSKKPENEISPQADTIPATAPSVQAHPAPAPQTAPLQQSQPAQSGPIQQFVQNNPIIKGIQSAVQRIQGIPNPETPRNEIIKEKSEETAEVKGKPLTATQGDSDISGVEDVEEQKEKNIIPKGEKEIVEEQVEAEETKIPSLSNKTE